MTMFARSWACSVTQPCQLPASSLTSRTCFSAANPSSGDTANTAARSRASCILIADLLLGRTVKVTRVHHDWTLAPLLLHFRRRGSPDHAGRRVHRRPVRGYPAVVCVLPAPRDESWMQRVAREMNLSETAFLVKRDDGFGLRWFTPTTEVALCGHATLGSAHVLWEEGHLAPAQQARFHTKSGL